MKSKYKSVALLSVTIILALFSFACAPAYEAVLANTPEPTAAATATATPTLSPAPTPTSAPTPTPMPELTYEQKKALLGIDERFRPHQVAALIAVELSFGNIKEGRIWCITYGQDNSSSSDDFHSAINDEYLFTFDFEIQHTSSSDISQCLVRSNENLKNLKLLNFTCVGDMAEQYKVWGKSYNNCKEVDDIYERVREDPNGVGNSFLSREQIVDLIISSTPQEKIVPFWVYTPGATIPDELKGIYSEADYPPAPAE